MLYALVSTPFSIFFIIITTKKKLPSFHQPQKVGYVSTFSHNNISDESLQIHDDWHFTPAFLLSSLLNFIAKMGSSSPPQPKEIPIDDKWAEEGTRRKAKWWYSTFHTVTAMVGAGVLSLPYAMAYLGWGPGTFVMALSWCVTLHTMW
ncbi:lysine histidine transporter-like 6 [Salvia splendens]|uniref:lysine histidine transporter-like 6 n=1 Tax=Salvia splendens TaxID=180675 RepID=UPI001C26BCC4|nr:lysine histidine transporter-like 6 [Salvia splendens]